MKPITKPGMPGAARVEYYACREDVEAMLAKGYNAKNAYDAMKEQGNERVRPIQRTAERIQISQPL